MKDCIFCKICNGEIPAKIIHDNEKILAFNDINPKAPHHVLVIPRKHIATINDLAESDTELVGSMIQTAKEIAASLDIADSGYRLIFNCNRDGGQEVYHIHLHLLGGCKQTWPHG